MRSRKLIALVAILISTSLSPMYGQNDTAYYLTYENEITGRFYFSNKFTALNFENKEDNYALRFMPNTTINMGFGATYKWATLNLAYGFPFLNPDRGRGKTRYLDLQLHSYGRKITLDVLGQFYKGFYLSPRGTASSKDNFYVRPDLGISAVGATFQYVFNHRKFSYRAAFLQNEWQQKSAGTFLIGIEFYGGGINADSSIVPTAINADIARTQVNRLKFIEFGPNGGYAYTVVINKNFFITGAASVSLNAGINAFYDKEGRNIVTGISPNTLFRISGGYNSRKWSVNGLYVSNSLFLIADEANPQVGLNAGNFRVNLQYRFVPNKRVKQYLDKFDAVDKEIKENIEQIGD